MQQSPDNSSAKIAGRSSRRLSWLALVLGALGMDYLVDVSRAESDLRTYLEVGGDDPRAQRWLDELTGR